MKPQSTRAALFADPASAAQRASAWAVGLNWYWNPNVTLMVSYEQTDFDGAAAAARDRDTERVLLRRLQLAF